MSIEELFDITAAHQKEHDCGGHPYQYGDVLTTLITALQPVRVLEVGTALGYTAACIARGSQGVFVETIDQDATHLEQARKYWNELHYSQQIEDYEGKAEEILPQLSDEYDLIFFDGYTPQLKFLPYFAKLLRKNGVLVTANLFLSDSKGGRYLTLLQDKEKWQTGVFADTALSVKLK